MARARQYSKRRVTTWFDKDFRALTLEQQGLYDALCSYPDLSRCGVVPLIPGRLVICSDGLKAAKLTKLIESLVERDYLRADWEFAELLIRSHIRHDEGMRTPNIARSIARAYEQIVSPYIRESVISELARLYYEAPNLPGWSPFELENGCLFEEVMQHPMANG